MKTAEFFGIGDFLLGSRWANQIPSFSCVNNEHERNVIESNFNIDVSIGLKDLKIHKIPRVDLVYIGKTKEKGLSKIIKGLNPRLIILEKNTIKFLEKDLFKGYTCQSDSYGAQEFRLPQTCRKVFCVFWNSEFKQNGYFHFPDGLEANEVPPKYVLSDILEDGPYRASRSNGTIYKPNQAIRKFPKNYHKNYNVLVEGKNGPKSFSIMESKKIMGFPSSFDMPVPKIEAYKMLGRATWPAAIATITKELVEWV